MNLKEIATADPRVDALVVRIVSVFSCLTLEEEVTQQEGSAHNI